MSSDKDRVEHEKFDPAMLREPDESEKERVSKIKQHAAGALLMGLLGLFHSSRSSNSMWDTKMSAYTVTEGWKEIHALRRELKAKRREDKAKKQNAKSNVIAKNINEVSEKPNNVAQKPVEPKQQPKPNVVNTHIDLPKSQEAQRPNNSSNVTLSRRSRAVRDEER